VRALHVLLSGTAAANGSAQQSLLADRSFSAALASILRAPASAVAPASLNPLAPSLAASPLVHYFARMHALSPSPIPHLVCRAAGVPRPRTGTTAPAQRQRAISGDLSPPCSALMLWVGPLFALFLR
jgi:hypothetical protein